MCGIAGIFEYGRTNGSIRPALPARMRDALRHRGPDDAGSYISPDLRVGLGMRRLASVGGAQTMFGQHGEVLVPDVLPLRFGYTFAVDGSSAQGGETQHLAGMST
jgi:asparagine synthetase B (glutamine-hydrolysing)